MTTADSNVNVGIDAGTSSSKLAFADNLSTRIIAELEGFDLLKLREEAEAFFDEMLFACVVAIPENQQRETLSVQAKLAGFRDVSIISAYEAMSLGLASDERALVYNFGASKSDIVVLEDGEILERAIIEDVCGNKFNKIFAEYLRERKLLDEVDENLLHEAERIKIVLSEENFRIWHNIEILREDFERLIYFPVRRASHVAQRLIRVHKPKRIILTGGCAKIPIVRRIFAEVLNVEAEIDFNIIVRGAAVKARSLSKETAKLNESVNVMLKLKEIRGEILEVEDKLTRSQKDRLYLLFKQAEGINDAGVIALMEKLISEIKNA